jgi:hypothetical protein
MGQPLVLLSIFSSMLVTLSSCGGEESVSSTLASGTENLSSPPSSPPSPPLIGTEDSEPQKHCVSHHLREAIDLNSERLEKYFAVSGGRSLPISLRLVTLERAILLVVPALEIPAKFYQKRGVPVLCLDMVPMEDAPPFVERVSTPVEPYSPRSGRELKDKLARLYDQGKLEPLEEALEKELAELHEAPSYHCMTRHLLESILRSARLEPLYERMSVERGLPKPNFISKTFIRAQIRQLAKATEIDDEAAPLQAEGIPIICRDVPPIPTDVPESFKDKL